MIEITDKLHEPSMDEIREYTENSLFDQLCDYLESEYKALSSIAYSRDKVLLGWNVSFRKGGRTLCRLYPKKGYFSILIVVGRKEKERVEKLLPGMSEAMQSVYAGTREGMGQRWLIMDLHDDGPLYEDVLRLVAIRRASK